MVPRWRRSRCEGSEVRQTWRVRETSAGTTSRTESQEGLASVWRGTTSIGHAGEMVGGVGGWVSFD